jgi:glycosyltransferase involved in cell wall biosynthesis
VDLFVAVSRATAEDQRINNPSTKKLVTVHEGVDLEIFDPRLQDRDKKQELGIPEGMKVVGNISRFDYGKGQHEFLDAAALVVQQDSKVVFLMVGDGDLMEELRIKTSKLGLANFVIFAGWRLDIAELLSVMDVFVHCPTTWIEAQGISTLEALAMGKPVVVSNNGGLPDAVIDGYNGFVVPVGDIQTMAVRITELLKDPELSKRFGRNGRRLAEERFDIKKNARELESLFEGYLV